MKGVATDYLTKPVDHQRLVVSLGNAAKMMCQQQDLSNLRSDLKETYKLEHMVGSSDAMARVRDMIRQAAPSDATVLITGESGTGKELVAKALHYASPRVGKAFVNVNCAALTETLIESEPSVTNGAPLRARFRRAAANSSKPTAALFFSTKSATCPWRRRPRCYGCCKRGRLKESAAKNESRSMCA
jgi:DNA-binding NtrC family response regulator